MITRLLSMMCIALIATAFAVAQGDPHAAETAKANALIKSGNQKMRDGDFDGAIADFNEVIKIDKIFPENVQSATYLNRGLAFQKKGDLDEALADYNKAIKLNSKFPFAYRGRGLLLLAQGKDTEAESDFAKYLQLYPNGKDSLEKQVEEVKQKRVAKP